MIKEQIAFIANYLWRQSINHLNSQLTETEIKNFSTNDYYYLTTIYHLGKPNFSQLADALKLTKPAISMIIKKLSSMGLIEKIQFAEDKRIYHISLTAKGKQIIDGDEELYEKIDLLVKKIVNSDEKYKELEKLFDELVWNLESNNLN
jgi:DNA-binding MarR family transcriptional regulator